MKNKYIKSINNIYIWIICIMSVIVLMLININFFQRMNQQKEQNINKYMDQILAQKNILEKGMSLMFNNVYIQRSWIEDLLSGSSICNSNDLIQYKIKYRSELNMSTIDSTADNLRDYYGNIFIYGDIKDKNQNYLDELERIKSIFNLQHYLNKNSLFESWSSYYSNNGYITIYPYQLAKEVLLDKDKVFDAIQDSIKQLNQIDDPNIYSQGWETDIFLDNTNELIMFSKFLPVKNQDEITGIVSNNISIKEISQYINDKNIAVDTYIADSSNNIVYKNDENIKTIESLTLYLQEKYNIDTTLNLSEQNNIEIINKNYFYILPLENVNWELVCVVPKNRIVNLGLSTLLTIIVLNITIIIIAIFLVIILKRNIKEFNKIENLKDEFLMTISHDLKAPLSSIIGFSEMIQKKFSKVIIPNINNIQNSIINKTVNRMNRNFSIINEEGNRLTHMINNLLDLSKLQSGDVYLKKEDINPLLLAQNAFEKTGSLIEAKGLEYRIISEPNIPNFVGDKQKLFQVLINIISNAVNFTNQGKIVCNISANKERIIFAIEDTGKGIPRESYYKIFEKFYQTNNSVDKNKGNGLGLAICKNIVELHNGDIWVESELEKGSTFYISLPQKEGVN